MENVGGQIRCIMGDVQMANTAASSRSCKPRIVLNVKVEGFFQFIRSLYKIVNTTTELMVSRIFFAKGSDSERTIRDSKN